MEQYNADWYCTQCPFWVLSTQLDNNDFPEPSRPEVMEVLEEAQDIDATLSGDVDIDYVKFRIKLNDYSFVHTGLWLWKVRYFKLHKKIYNMTFKDFCKKIVGKNYTTCLDMMKASRVWLANNETREFHYPTVTPGSLSTVRLSASVSAGYA